MSSRSRSFDSEEADRSIVEISLEDLLTNLSEPSQSANADEDLRDLEALLDELQSLDAIYPGIRFFISSPAPTSLGKGSSSRLPVEIIEIALKTTITIEDDSSRPPHHHDQDQAPLGATEPELSLRMRLESNYPSSSSNHTSPVEIDLNQKYLGNYKIDQHLLQLIHTCFRDEEQPDQTSGGHATNQAHDQTLSNQSRDEDGMVLPRLDWTPGQVCLFDAIEWVREMCTLWYNARSRRPHDASHSDEEQEEDDDQIENGVETQEDEWTVEQWIEWQKDKTREHKEEDGRRAHDSNGAGALELLGGKNSRGLKISSSDPIVDRKSVFVGHAAAVTSQQQIDAVMAELLSDKKIARASHNIKAFRYFDATTRALHHDTDDDGESAAGSRLGHLLSLLEVENVLVVVTRWFGGIHLGADRFKDINQAARDALTVGGFLHDESSSGGQKKK